jgi:hypothetical protein
VGHRNTILAEEVLFQAFESVKCSTTPSSLVDSSWRVRGTPDTHTFLEQGVGIRLNKEGGLGRFEWRLIQQQNGPLVHVRGSGKPKVFCFTSERVGWMRVLGSKDKKYPIHMVY